jgi:hypothetical protein
MMATGLLATQTGKRVVRMTPEPKLMMTEKVFSEQSTMVMNRTFGQR